MENSGITLYSDVPSLTSALENGEITFQDTIEALNNLEDENAQNLIMEALTGAENNCFLAGTMIDMWPTDLGLLPNINGCYDEAAVRAKVWQKPIEEMTPNDWVVSFDKQGNLKPGKVTRTMTNEAKVILDFHGTFVTPGHVYYCAGGKNEGGFAPLIDILRDDGVIQREDCTLIRATTGCEVGSEDDKEFWAFLLYTEEGEDVNRVRAKTKLRLGTRWMQPNGNHFSMREYMDGIGLELLDNGYVRWKETGITSVFAWVLSDTLPEPEGFILARSQTTLEDIYRAGQWEGVRPQMPVPMVMDGGPVQSLPEHKLDMMPRNTPMAAHAGAPSSEIVASHPKMNRKQRKAQEAKQRKATKAKRSRMH
ncbi:MAG: hypothetical protein JKY94_10860 [Rhodobacteraceae bacterium]|nr:hypothetical protein [Paracoccaceae bacterium]